MPVLEHALEGRASQALRQALFAASVAGVGVFLYVHRERVSALAARYVGGDLLWLTEAVTRGLDMTIPSVITDESQTDVERERVWDMLSTRPEILNSFLFCSCGCGEWVDYGGAQFEMLHGRVFKRTHFRCTTCGNKLQGTTHAESR